MRKKEPPSISRPPPFSTSTLTLDPFRDLDAEHSLCADSLMFSGSVATPVAHTHGPLSRTNTAPVFNSRSAGGPYPTLSQTMSHSSRSSQLSGSTAYASSSSTSLSSMTSSATLVPPTPMAQNGGPVVATNNIINQKADASRSLYQICISLRQRLAQVPGFDSHLSDSDDEDEGEDMDPVSSLWRCLRKGIPMLTIYNSLQPEQPLRIDENMRADKKPKAAAFLFVKECLGGELKIPSDVCFAINDLFGDDTTGFVKVARTINIVLDAAESRGLLLDPEQDESVSEVIVLDENGKKPKRYYIVEEFVQTERKYVQDLENLHELKKAIEAKGVITGDVVHAIFLNINAILDFQRRFLIKIETTNSQKEDDQRWGAPFVNYEEAFHIYQPFIANQRKAAALARQEYEKIKLTEHPVALDDKSLDGFLLKPMQRLVKYPMLLKDLHGAVPEDYKKPDLWAGYEASSRVLSDANSAVDRELRNEALEDLCARVDDWKNHRVDHFGDLLLHGHFPVVTGKSDVQKEVRPQLDFIQVPAVNEFRTTVGLKCKSLLSHLRRSDPKLVQRTGSSGFERDLVSPTTSELRRNSSPCQPSSLVDSLDLFLSNQIFHHFEGVHPVTGDPFLAGQFANILGISCPHYDQYTIYLFERILLCCKDLNPNKSKDKLMGTQKDKKDKKDKKGKEPNKNAKLQLKGRIFMTNVTEVLSLGKPGSYTVQIFWKGDPGVENFIIRFSTEETMKRWYDGVDSQRKAHATTITSGSSPDNAPQEFAWIREQATPMQNPYAVPDEDDDDDDAPSPPYISNSAYPAPLQGMPRNASSTSLRSRSTTADSQSLAGIVRAPPPRFPINMNSMNPPLSLQTQIAPQMPSPGPRGGDSYFSPVAESPVSSRTSTQSSMFPFPRQGTSHGGWEEHNRYTAPAGPRASSRGSQNSGDYHRAPQRPSLPVMSSQQQASVAQQRSRSYSTPDINVPNGRRLPNGAQVPAVPGIPPHLHPAHQAYDAGIPRSNSNSPSNLPMRSNTQSPGVQRERLAQGSQYPNAPQYARSNTTQIPMMSNADSRTMSPPLGSTMSEDSDIGLPTQLKVKVNCDGNYVTLVVAFNITYQSLVDRIDAKVGRFSRNAIALGTMRLRYRDEDGDFVSIESDDDIQIAFQEWREAQKQQYSRGQLGEIELFCIAVEN